MASAVPPGIRILPKGSCGDRNVTYRVYILIFTFLCYTCYHMSRKPISVVKSVLHRNCSKVTEDSGVHHLGNDTTWCDWKPFDGSDYSELFGTLDLVYLFAYAISMFFSGHIAERMSLRYFLSGGMIMSGLLTAAFGMGYFWNIHNLGYYIAIQVVGGMFQSTGWPAVVSCMGNWYGKGKRGLIMGIWNSHTSVGNILGSLIAGSFVTGAWGWSFVLPGIIIGILGVLVFFLLVPDPADVGCSLPDHQGTNVTSNDEDRAKEPDIESEEVELRVVASDAVAKPPLSGACITSDTPWNEGDLVVSVITTADNLPMSQKVNMEYSSSTNFVKKKGQPDKPIGFFAALRIPGVVEFSLCLFFAKLVSYTFLFWLPKYISSKSDIDAEKAADLSTFFDVGGILGGITAGLVSDYTGARATTCVIQLMLAAPVMYIYNLYGSIDLAHSIGLSILCGFMVNGPYALITTAVSADLGTHKVLQGNSKALATVTAIIDGTGSIGAAIGPLLAGIIETTGWNNVFYMLIGSDILALLLLIRLFVKEVLEKVRSY
ncbi:glucose-6-phosphate exchanger SLC37A2-like isoform X1 [Mizuhopecten yessoensis]|uniref:glucose-6-phosphate exchanger SLC37A2-like isoform X1 n=1 Tax=Mizuhopecten yessoensis TaxID=6573 RepID=UPI000B45C754|nr:glucose-6-phosphate exchanger SLC37A2-like isoform X1 [Mizuhopecten yessoensis]